ncbi:MAG: hypothetical protein AB8H12_03190 [Lewinella sp.]
MRSIDASPSLFSKVIAYGVLPLLLILLLCTCGPAPKTTPVSLVGNIRYDESTQVLNVDVAIDPLGNGFPTLYGSAMPALPAAGAGHFRGRRTIPFASPIKLSIPCTSKPCPLDLAFTPPFADSIPAIINKQQSVRFAACNTGLQASENLVAFFEPDNRSTPRRILLQGPSSTGMLSLPKEALADIPAGNYQVYLVKQQLYKDSLSTLQSSVQTEYFTRMVPVEIKE